MSLLAFPLLCVQVILKEREEKKRLRLLEDGVTVDVTSDLAEVKNAVGLDQNEGLSQEGKNSGVLH